MKKLVRLLCMLTLFAMLLTLLGVIGAGAEETAVPADASKWDGVVPEADKEYEFEGSGTEEDPWLIQSAADLAQLAANVRLNDRETTYGGKFFELTVDIDIDNKEWWAIGGCRAGTDGLSTAETDDNRYSYFAGTFDGGNHKIYNLALADSTEVVDEETGQTQTVALHQQGLFGVIMGATIKNIGIESGDIQLVNSNRSAALVGAGRCGFLIENCYNKADVTIDTNFKAVYVGALVGQVIDPWNNKHNTEQNTIGIYKQKRIQDCYNTGNLTVTLNQTDGANEFRIGSITGQYVGGSPELINVYSICTVDITSNSVASSKTNHRIGGITGAFLDSGYAENVYFKGDILFKPTVVTDLSKYTLGILFGQASGNLTGEMLDGTPNVGYCVTDATTAVFTKAVGTHTEPADWYGAVDDVVIPLAENCDFIVDINAEPIDPDDDDDDDPQPPVTDDEEETDDDSAEVATREPEPTEEPGGSETTPDTSAPSSGDEEGCGSSIGLLPILLMSGVAAGAAVGVSRRRKD